MKWFPEKSKKTIRRYFWICICFVPIIWGMSIFLRLGNSIAENPEYYWDSPASALVGYMFAGVIICPPLFIVLGLLLSGHPTETDKLESN